MTKIRALARKQDTFEVTHFSNGDVMLRVQNAFGASTGITLWPEQVADLQKQLKNKINE